MGLEFDGMHWCLKNWHIYGTKLFCQTVVLFAQKKDHSREGRTCISCIFVQFFGKKSLTPATVIVSVLALASMNDLIHLLFVSYKPRWLRQF
jgi:hypothetical protein